jgi:hypothetical protein
MATEALKSGPITNRDASPSVKNNPAVEGGKLQSAAGTVEVTTADSGSTYRMFQVPSNARMHRLLVYTDAAIVALLADIGLYKTTADGGAVVDADFFASAADLSTAAENGTDVTHESGVYNIDDVEKTLWEGLGLSSDPGIFYDVVITSTTAATTGGTVSLKGEYVNG